MNSEPKNMPIEASDREMDSVMLGIESRTIGEEMPKKLEKMLIQRSTVKRKKDLVCAVAELRRRAFFFIKTTIN